MPNARPAVAMGRILGARIAGGVASFSMLVPPRLWLLLVQIGVEPDGENRLTMAPNEGNQDRGGGRIGGQRKLVRRKQARTTKRIRTLNSKSGRISHRDHALQNLT
jgi:hypothetical protein